MESAPGKGTTMRLKLELPRAPADQLRELTLPGRHAPGFVPRPQPSVAEAERERSLILLVDDHATNRLVIQRQLALAGYATETAEDGIEGLERWRSGRYALLLSDVHMPRMDGYQLARTIRAEEEGRGLARTPIVALTASALKGEAERCLGAGMDDYLTKPVGIAALGVCLQRWLPHTANGAAAPASPPVAAPAPPTNAPLPTQAPPAGDDTVLVADVLRELAGERVDDIRALLDDYLRCTAEDMEALQRLRAGGALQALTSQAHRIKGAARLVGATGLAEAASALENALRSGAHERLAALEDALHAAHWRLREHVARQYPG